MASGSTKKAACRFRVSPSSSLRPNQIHLVGYDLDGNEVSIEAEELEGRCFQHELDHLDGTLYLDRLDDDQRKEAKRALREMNLRAAAEAPRPASGLSLP